MYAQRNPTSDTLLTQAFHPPSAEDQYAPQNFLEEQQQQQQQQFNQEQLNPSNMVQITDTNNFAFQTFDNNNILGTSLPTDWEQLCGSGDMVGLVGNPSFPFVGGLMSPNFVDDDGSWILDQTAEQQSLQLSQQQEVQQVHTPQSLSNSPSDTDSNESNVSSNPDDQMRAQTPAPLHKTIIPNYLTIRRRSLSADNIHALAKSQQAVNRKPLYHYPTQQHAEQISFDRSGLSKSTVPSTMSLEQMQFFQSTKQQPQQQGLRMQGACIPQNVVKVESQNGNQISNDNDCDRNNSHQQNNSRTSSPSPRITATAPTHRPHLSRSVSHQQIGPINHTQRLNELQARFKVKLDKRNQRSMPNIQLAAAAHGAMIQSQNSIPLKTNSSSGPVPGAVSIMEISSLSTPTTPTFPNEKASATKQTLAPPPRRGHMRKRSLSAPTTPFPNIAQPLPNSVPLQSAPAFPLNIYNHRPNALPIQIQRNPKHSHATTAMSSEEYQRKLDEELEKVDFDDITVSELKEMLRQRGKPATGKKAVLMQRLQEEVEYVKAMKNSGNQQPKNNNNSNAQFSQMISSPTSPSGVSLQRSIANLHISSPPTHSRRYSPYGSVSIPGSPRMMPSGLGNGRSGFNGGNVAYAEGDEWQYNIGIQPLMSNNMDEQSHSIMMMEAQSQQSQDMYGQQQPSSAPPTTTEFDQTSSMATEFVDFMNPMSMNLMSVGSDMMRMSVSDTDNPLLKQESDSENKSDGHSTDPLVSSASNDDVAGILAQQALEFGFNSQHQLQGENMMIKSEDYLNYSAQHIPMQLELQQQDGMSFSGW